MEILLTCKYCNNQWVRNVYSGTVSDEKCVKCGDTNIEAKDLSKTKIDQYQGCPAFPEEQKEETAKSFPYWTGGD